MTDAPRALIVTGGIFHPFDETGPQVATILRDAGFEPVLLDGVADGLARFTRDGADLLVLHCLAWTMTQAEKYAPYRADLAYDPPAPVRAAIRAHLAAGRGLLGLHTAAICFDTWADWGAILGAGWVWGRSHHPVPGPVHVASPAAHPVTEGVGAFDLTDELYCAMTIAPDATVLATATTPAVAGPQPVVTARAEGAGRVVYSALGHDAASFAAPQHARLVAQAATWAAGCG
jgi:type 1 glutamine amidotransferase